MRLYKRHHNRYLTMCSSNGTGRWAPALSRKKSAYSHALLFDHRDHDAEALYSMRREYKQFLVKVKCYMRRLALAERLLCL